MKIVIFFGIIVAIVLMGFVVYFVKTHPESDTRLSFIHVFLLSQNDDGFRLKVNSTEFNPDVAEEGDRGEYSYLGKVPKNSDSAHVHFRARNIDTTFRIEVADIDTIAIGVNNGGELSLKKF
ncbi:MAG: hypothetical protein QM610_02125 [Chitinophagaceae bacterium]